MKVNVRYGLARGLAIELKQSNTVRVHGPLNACRYELPTPTGRQTFAIESEVAACPWNADRQLVRFTLNTRAIDKDKLPPGNFVFLVDVSGSMRGADRLPLVWVHDRGPDR